MLWKSTFFKYLKLAFRYDMGLGNSVWNLKIVSSPIVFIVICFYFKIDTQFGF